MSRCTQHVFGSRVYWNVKTSERMEEWLLCSASAERVNILEGHAVSEDCSFRPRGCIA